MLASTWPLFLALCLGGLNKALAGKASSSKRKAAESESDDWAHFALHLHSSNQLPGTEAKRNIEKAASAGAKGLKLRGKKGKKNAARTLKRAWPKTTWPSLYSAQIPIKDKKSSLTQKIWWTIHFNCHMSGLGHIWWTPGFWKEASLHKAARCTEAEC